ncbi:MAG: hypothetical protein ACI9T8_000064 [Candidatus Saccharimonadales bacterium]|jgi:hypothetical protein
MQIIYSKRYLALVAVLSTSCLAGVILLIDPTNKSVIYTFIPIIFSWISSIAMIQLVLLVLLPKPKRLYFILGTVGVTVSMILFLMSGLGQLTGRDILLSSSLVVLCTFYFYRSWA